MSLAIKDHVVRFKVSKDNHIFVQGFEGQNKFTDIFFGLFFRDGSFFAN